jgi:putative ABC transport system ATP-binding protein
VELTLTLAPDSMTQQDLARSVLTTHDLCKNYAMGEVTVHALRHVDFELMAGEMTVLLGASGSGKSTLLNIIGGLDVATSGTVMYGEQNLSQFSDRALTEYRRFHVGFVFQFYNLISSLIALVTEIAPDPMSPDAALELVGLADRVNHFPSQLSGGEQQRVAIARAIAKRPSILLCDEPTGALDAETGKLVLRVLDQVNTETNTTTAIITHNAAIGALGDVVVRMRSGEIAERIQNSSRANVDDINW